MAGRPRKYINAQEAAAAKLAKDRIYTQQRRRQNQSSSHNLQFILYEPTQQDAPPPTSSATATRSDLNLPTEEDATPIVQQGIVVSQGRLEQVQVPAPPPVLQTEEREVEEVVGSLNLCNEVDEEREAAIILQTLRHEGEDKIEEQPIAR